MWLLVSEQWESKIELIPEGMYPARCFQIVDFGTQQRTFKDTDKEIHEIGLAFEIPELTYEFESKETGEKVTNTKTISATFTASLNSKANLRKFLDTWRGRKFTEEELKGFDLKKVVGAECMLQIIHSDDGKWANIQAAMPLYKGVVVDKTDREQVFFEMDFEKAAKWETFYDEKAFDSFPEFIQKKIMESKEYKKAFGVESIEDQEENMKAEAAAKTATAEDANNVFGE